MHNHPLTHIKHPPLLCSGLRRGEAVGSHRDWGGGCSGSDVLRTRPQLPEGGRPRGSSVRPWGRRIVGKGGGSEGERTCGGSGFHEELWVRDNIHALTKGFCS
jgi:hypothetical protein